MKGRLRIAASYRIDFIQQLDCDDIPIVPAMLEPPQDAPRPEGTTIIGLVPESPSSVDPSGIPILTDDDPPTASDIADVLEVEVVNAVEPQVPD
jgi:hypothetical protein